MPIKNFHPGQYVSLQVPVPDTDGLLQSRQFSISSAPIDSREQLRVTVKRGSTVANPTKEEIGDGKVPGLISNILHDQYNAGNEVELSPPRGIFLWDNETSASDTPLVLLSLGVGATPVRAILDSVLQSSNPLRPVTYIHGARHAGAVCFGEHVRSIARDHSNVTSVLFVKHVREGDDYTFEGRMNFEALHRSEHLRLDNKSTHYFICGPQDWMGQTKIWLARNGVTVGNIHVGLFGTGSI